MFFSPSGETGFVSGTRGFLGQQNRNRAHLKILLVLEQPLKEEIYLRLNRIVVVGFKNFLIYLILERVQDNSAKLLCVGTGQVGSIIV